MDLLNQDSIAKNLRPVLVGLSAESAETARRLYRKHGVISHVFCGRVSLAMRLSICMRFHKIPSACSERLLLEALQDFADAAEGSDALLCLIPATPKHASLLQRHRDLLERRFLLADPAPVESACEKGGVQ